MAVNVEYTKSSHQKNTSWDNKAYEGAVLVIGHQRIFQQIIYLPDPIRPWFTSLKWTVIGFLRVADTAKKKKINNN